MPIAMPVRFTAIALFVAAPSLIHADATPPEGFVALFNGEDLTGWQGVIASGKPQPEWTDEKWAEEQAKADASMNEHWSVEEGVLVFDGKGQSLSTDRDYRDFELLVDWKIAPGGDSGIYLRGCPQVQIWDTEHEAYFKHGAEKGSGSLWNNKVHPRFPTAKADNPAGDWNTFHITMIGPYVTVKLNGTTVVDRVVLENYWDRSRPIDQTGPIFLQNHGNKLSFRNIFLREIDDEEANATLHDDNEDFQAIFNGMNSKGWSGATENYNFADGAITCLAGKGGVVYTERTYDDFVAQLEFKLPPGGNNGLAIRYPGKGSPHIDGFCELQVLDGEHKKYANIHDTQHHGSVYALVPAKRGFMRPAGEWNYQKVTVDGSTIRVELNGYEILNADVAEVTESKDGKVPAGVNVRSGHFGFAGHNDAVSFRNVSIKPLGELDRRDTPASR